MIYQHVNKITKILPLATSHIAHSRNQFNLLALPISMPRFKSNFYQKFSFYQNSPKFKLYLQKFKVFERWGLHPQTPVPPAAEGFAPRFPASGGLGLRSQISNCLPRLEAPLPNPQNSPPLRISGYAPAHICEC